MNLAKLTPDFWIYEETIPGNPALKNNVANLHGVLAGHAGAPGGNVEFFPTITTALLALVPVVLRRKR